MKIVLVEANEPRENLAWTSWFDAEGRFAMPSAGLATLASLVRPHDSVRIIDEKVDGPCGTIDADLVGISFKTMFAKRAYRIADDLRRRGVKVVLGGVHVSAQPMEALEHADIVAVGEGEGVWRQILDDVERGNPQLLYRTPGNKPHPLDQLPPTPLLDNSARYQAHAFQSARGCSFGCEFCPTRSLFGDTYRLRSADAVVADVARAYEADPRPVFFTENVFGAGHLAFLGSLTSRLQAMSIPYGAICDWQIVTPPMVELLIRNGLGLVGINITGRPEPQEEAALKAFHDAGVPIWGYLMCGFEEDTPGVFECALEKVRRYDMVCVSPTVLAPYPGTPMGMRLAKEGRIFDPDTDLLDQHHVVFEPTNMTAKQLQDGYDWFCSAVADRISFTHAADVLRRAGAGARP